MVDVVLGASVVVILDASAVVTSTDAGIPIASPCVVAAVTGSVVI